MNCVNHPEAAVSAFCQNCGKGLCTACVRNVQGNVYCEPCLAARMPGAPGTPAGYPPGFAAPGPGPNPGTAAVLGFIPGVGAMYNGQYIKAIVHVLVFVVLIGISEHYGLFGIFLAVWVLYQVFDAHQTAKARRDGLPLPDPFGLNELGNAIGGHSGPRPFTPPVPPVPPPPGAVPGAPPANQSQAYADWGEQLRQRIVAEAHQAGQPRPFYPPGAAPWGQGPTYGPGYGPGYGPSFGPAYGPPGTPPPPGAGYAAPPPPPGWVPAGTVPPPVPPEMELERARREPIGAIVLILLGMLFLFNTLGFFSMGWIGHGWPWVIVAIAVWLLMRNRGGRFGMGPRVAPPSSGMPPTGMPPAGMPPAGSQQPEPPAGGGQ